LLEQIGFNYREGSFPDAKVGTAFYKGKYFQLWLLLYSQEWRFLMVNGSVAHVKIIGMVSFILLGFLFHELYDLTGNTLLGIISPVNESKWEHWKMVYFPMVIVSLFEYHFIKNYVSNYIFSLLIGILVFTVITFGLIELYDIFIGDSHLLVHVSTFLLGGVAGQMARYFVMVRTEPSKTLLLIGIVFLLIQFALFTVFTFVPPKFEYFRDPITDTYGIDQQKTAFSR